MPANDVCRLLPPTLGEFDDHAAVPGRYSRWLQRIVAGVDERLVLVHLGRVRVGGNQTQLHHFVDGDTDRQRAMHLHAPDLSNFCVLGQNPKFFQYFVELLLVGHGEEFLGGNAAVVQLNPAIGQARNYRVVSDHHDGSSLLV